VKVELFSISEEITLNRWVFDEQMPYRKQRFTLLVQDEIDEWMKKKKPL